MDKEHFISQMFYRNCEERESLGLKPHPNQEEYYRMNTHFVDVLWRDYEKNNKHPFSEEDGE